MKAEGSIRYCPCPLRPFIDELYGLLHFEPPFLNFDVLFAFCEIQFPPNGFSKHTVDR